MKRVHSLLSISLICALLWTMGAPPIAAAADYTTTWTYDDLGRPLSVNVGGATADFAYDAAGNRTVASLSPGSTAPSVVVVVPPAGATGVSPHATVVATFSRPVNPATVTTGPSGTFRLTGPGDTAVSGTVSVHDLEAVFVPGAPLQNSTIYTATVTTGVKDLGGRALIEQKVWNFTSGTAPDLTPPTVLSTTPGDKATSVPAGSTVTALFSEALDPSTVTDASFLVLNAAATVWGSVAYHESTHSATFTPSGPLDPDVTYTAVLLASITDLSGNRMAANKEWNFTTEATGTPVVPSAEYLTPYDTEPDVPLRTSVGVIFNKAMDGNTINGSTFTVKKGTVAVSGSVSYNPIKHQATFISTAALDPETLYSASLSTGIKDAGGIPLPSPVTWSFTTAPLPPFLVTCNLAGAGTGSIDSTPPNLACGVGSCSGTFPQKKTVLLSPLPDSSSLFAGWGAPCTGSGNCSFMLDADTMLTAAFDLKPARIDGMLQYFTSLQAAYNEESVEKTIQSRAVPFVESLNCNQAKKILLKGGYTQDYAGQTGYTSIKGTLIIGKGSLTVDRLIVK